MIEILFCCGWFLLPLRLRIDAAVAAICLFVAERCFFACLLLLVLWYVAAFVVMDIFCD